MKNELKKFQNVLGPDYPKCLAKQNEDEEVLDDDEEEYRKRRRKTFLKMTIHFLKRMEQDELAECLQSSRRTFQTQLLANFHEYLLTDLICHIFI